MQKYGDKRFIIYGVLPQLISGKGRERRTMMNLTQSVKVITVIVLATMLPLSACASSDNSDNQKRRKPPKVAFEACEGKAVGDSVTFTGRRGETLKATCKEMQGQLVAVPERGPSNQGEPGEN
jgi:hypothetical protein